MIGVVCKANQKATAEEFFQLFKVPWQRAVEGKYYDAMVVTDSASSLPAARLVMIFDPVPRPGDSIEGITVVPVSNESMPIKGGTGTVPLYTSVSTFRSSWEPVVFGHVDEPLVIRIHRMDKVIMRVGYDLFQEVEVLLGGNQPVEHALSPTLDTHISLMRKWLLESGIPLVEIPPTPPGHDFTVCLTHDVDFLGIRHHGLDRTMLGFLARVLSPGSYRGLGGRILWKRLGRNLKAMASLPLVYLGLAQDFWYQLNHYARIEQGKRSTFYFIPYPDHPGEQAPTSNTSINASWRAARYNVKQSRASIHSLIEEGHEVGLHGLDAWSDAAKGAEEKKVIQDLTGTDCRGVRMHWLYFNERSPQTLEEAGFRYDSTLGYNEAVGFRSGTTQVHKRLGSNDLLELPLHIQDSALFYRGRMGLDETQAFSLCNSIINDARLHGGVLTINWHQRSLAPERNWDGFYIQLLKTLEDLTPWFAQAGEAVDWFAYRRAVQFGEVSFNFDRVTVHATSGGARLQQPMRLRIYLPETPILDRNGGEVLNLKWVERIWHGEPVMEIPIQAE